MVTYKMRKQVTKCFGHQKDDIADWEIEEMYKQLVTERAVFWIMFTLGWAAIILGWLVIFGLRWTPTGFVWK